MGLSCGGREGDIFYVLSGGGIGKCKKEVEGGREIANLFESCW